MNTAPVSQEAAEQVRSRLKWFLAIVVTFAAFSFFTFSWLETRQTATIVFHASPQAHLAVDVRGAVSTPGVVQLNPGARMIDVIDASGGLTEDADRSLINLSTRVNDGQLIVVPTAVLESSDGHTAGLININTASAEELKELPGIGDVLANRIVMYREFNGPFQNVDQLIEVEGISSSLVESLRPLVTVSGND